MNIYIYVCMYIYLCLNIYKYIYTYIYIYTHNFYVSALSCVCVRLKVTLNNTAYIYMHVCGWLCTIHIRI